MPRQIIDTESSRPRYVRRVVVTVVLVVIAIAILLIVAFAAWGRLEGRKGNTASPAVSWEPNSTHGPSWQHPARGERAAGSARP